LLLLLLLLLLFLVEVVLLVLAHNATNYWHKQMALYRGRRHSVGCDFVAAVLVASVMVVAANSAVSDEPPGRVFAVTFVVVGKTRFLF
jgi:hypothetical protein